MGNESVLEKRKCSVVLRRRDKSILETKVSIPKVSIYKLSSSQDISPRRPHSVHLDQDNYLYLQQINEVEEHVTKQTLMVDWLNF